MDTKKVTNVKKKFSNVSVKYVSDWRVEFEQEEPIFLAEYSYSHAVRSHSKRYHNSLYLLAGLSMCARNLMDYITEEMNEENLVYTNAYFRKGFIKTLQGTTNNGVVYSDSSVKKALGLLTSKGLIRNLQRGASRVNPKYFWKNDDTDRVQAISMELRFEKGADTKLAILKKEYPQAETKE